MRKPLKSKPIGKKFPVVGVGASAGGLDAYKLFVNAIPEDSGMAYILVQHLDPTHESMLSEILTKQTPIPVHQITDNINLVPDHIYILPSNRLVVAVDGILKLKPRLRKDKKNMPIDLFFSSLAEVHKDQAVGIIFSGTGTDGTRGLQAIKEQGGITIVQEPGSAAYSGMPQNAIAAKVVNFILPPEEIPGQLLKLFKQAGHEKPDPDKVPLQEDETFRHILALLRIRRSMDFTYYKQNTLKRRIARRMALANIREIGDYLNFLKKNTDELDALFDDLLILVTAFFRDETAFEALRSKVFPVLTKNKSVTEPIRIWVAGCSTGEEVYSIAISLFEYLGTKASHVKVQIFGTDISEKAIQVARSGFYNPKQLEAVSPSRLQQFFTRIDGNYQVAKFIRDMCVFANHNFLKDPPFAKMDLITCRNVLIYMDSFLQKKALTTFHYALNQNGFLLLGKSETIGSVSELFSLVENHEKIYSKKNVPGRFVQYFAPEHKENFKTEKVLLKAENLVPDFQKKADDILLQEYMPAGVVINEQADIVHFRGDTGPYLMPSPGKPNLNLFKMARKGLSFELRNALHKAKKNRTPIHKEGIPVSYNGTKKRVTINVIPLPKTIEPYYLILFQDNVPLPDHLSENEENVAKHASGKKAQQELRIQQLEQELAQSREDMKAITEEQEAANEELQSANEELLSGSEELQSLNEELETTKEELQSANEEMIIVNHELTERNTLINDARNYADAIIATIREPLVILTKNLQIRMANSAFYTTFKVTEAQTEGKFLYEIGNNQWDNAGLRTLLQNITTEKTTVVDFEISHDFPNLGERTMLLNARLIKREADAEKLILLAIEDITEKKLAKDKLEQLNQQLENLVEARTKQWKEANSKLMESNNDLLQFAHVASHDLKEPLRKIKTYVSRLEEDAEIVLPEKGKVYLSKVQTAADRMTLMIEGVLNYSMLNASENNVEIIDLNQTLKDILADLELLIQQKQATITYSLLPQIEGAQVLIYQLFYNLINNALKFTNTDKKQVISITSKTIRQQGKVFSKITIKDTGIGFEAQYANEIFNTFTRLNPKEKYEGTGLGLTLCKRIAERHGGTITATGKKNRGAVFTILLPLQQSLKHI